MRISRIQRASGGRPLVAAVTIAPPALRRGRARAALLVAGLALIPATVAQASFKGLGDLPGDRGSQAYAVSADGSVVVGFSYYDAPGGLLQSHAFVWTEADGMYALFDGQLDYTSAAFAISADGLTIGGWHAPTITEEKAFIWSAAQGEKVLATRSGVMALSNDGAVGAGYVRKGHETGRAAMWDADRRQIFIDSDAVYIPGSDARGVSADGAIIVGQAMFKPHQAARAFVWTAASGMQNIGSPDEGGPLSHADAVTPDGSVVVGAAQANGGSDPLDPALWTAGGRWQILGHLPGDAGGVAYAVSADGGTVVGASNGHAFIWRAGRGIEDLNVLLAPPDGWTLADARGISADGRIIIGNGSKVGGGGAWIATLPSYGDLNCDGVVDFGDIDPFVLALSDPVAYQATYPDCDILNGDVNGDGSVDFNDIDGFVTCLINGGCP